MATAAVVKLKDGRTRRFRSKEERRQIVEETRSREHQWRWLRVHTM